MAGLPIKHTASGLDRCFAAAPVEDDDADAQIVQLRRRVATVAAGSGFLIGLAAIAAALELPTFV